MPFGASPKRWISPTGMTPRLEIIPLAHAAAEELQPIIDDILGASARMRGRPPPPPRPVSPSGAPRRFRRATTAPKPKVVADPRQNALLVYAVESDLDGLRSIIRKLDEEAKTPKQTLRFVKLLHTNADDMQDTLRELLGQASGGSRGNTGNRAPTGNTRGTTGAAAGQLGEVRIVGDRGTNSLLVSADASSWPIVKELVDGLDRPRRQIWIEAAVVEMTDEDLTQLGVEITAIQNGGDPNVGFASALGLSTTIRETGATTNALSSFQRVPFLTSTGGISFEGGVMGVFSDDFNFPALIAMAERRNKGRLVATPTILAAENAGSKLEVGTSVAFSTQNTSRAVRTRPASAAIRTPRRS
jgi:general secretion pathway protein D